MNLLAPHTYYSQADILQLDLNGIHELKLSREFNNYLVKTELYIKAGKNIRHLPPLLQVSYLFISNIKIRKINCEKLDEINIHNSRVKCIKYYFERLIIKHTKIKDFSYVGDKSKNKYLKFLYKKLKKLKFTSI